MFYHIIILEVLHVLKIKWFEEESSIQKQIVFGQ